MSARPVKRSLTLRGHRTSVSLEDEFWQAFRDIAKKNRYQSMLWPPILMLIAAWTPALPLRFGSLYWVIIGV